MSVRGIAAWLLAAILAVVFLFAGSAKLGFGCGGRHARVAREGGVWCAVACDASCSGVPPRVTRHHDHLAAQERGDCGQRVCKFRAGRIQ